MLVGAPALAQIAGSVGVDSADRYRGQGTDGPGPVIHVGLSADLPQGLYGAIGAHWSTSEGEVADIDGLLGWSVRLSDPAATSAVDAAWGWDLAMHRRIEGDGLHFASTEWMAGLLGPGFETRLWWSPNYDDTGWSTIYAELNAAHSFNAHWQVYAHLGWLRYASHRASYWGVGFRPGDRADGRIGASYGDGRWTVRLARDGLLSGPAYGTDSQRHAAWILGAELAF